VKQCLPTAAARGTATPGGSGWPVWQVDSDAHPYPLYLLPGPASTQGQAVLSLAGRG
jgi:hypothetical protein